MSQTTSNGIFREFDESGLDLQRLGGNTGKIRLSLDLAALAARGRRLRVLDVGCVGPAPLNLWEPFVPLVRQLDLVGVDVCGLERAEERARQLRLSIELHDASVHALTQRFGFEAFDVVVSTQVLEHVRDWEGGMSQMRDVLRAGGTLFLTCDSSHFRRTLAGRTRLRGKRIYAVLRERVDFLGRVGDRLFSGEWEQGRTIQELREVAERLDLKVERLSPYALGDVKRAQRHAGSRTRQLWLALEEELASESSVPLDPALFTILYLRATRLRGRLSNTRDHASSVRPTWEALRCRKPAL
jgi:SAM-dependent methyltransferase